MRGEAVRGQGGLEEQTPRSGSPQPAFRPGDGQVRGRSGGCLGEVRAVKLVRRTLPTSPEDQAQLGALALGVSGTGVTPQLAGWPSSDWRSGQSAQLGERPVQGGPVAGQTPACGAAPWPPRPRRWPPP